MAHSPIFTMVHQLSQMSLPSSEIENSCSSCSLPAAYRDKSAEEESPRESPVGLSFEDTFTFLIEDNFEDPSGLGVELAEMREWLKKVMKYNVPHGKLLRGRLVEMTFEGLEPDASKQMFHLSRILGWIVEIMQAAFIVADDIVDAGHLRRGQPCWHRLPNNENNAINDAVLLEQVAYQILRKYFQHLPCYQDLLDLCLRVTFKTIMGQSLDIRTSFNNNTEGTPKRENGDPFENYNLQLYNSIVQYKTSYYTCYLPVALALSLSGISQKAEITLWQQVEKVTLEIGHLFQVQDDYFDCFGDEAQIGKVGMDIQEGKCSWTFVTAKNLLLQAPPGTAVPNGPQQYAVLRENYAKFEEESVTVVKQLYRDLALPKLFREYQVEMFKNIKESITQVHHAPLQSVFLHFFDMVYQRTF